MVDSKKEMKRFFLPIYLLWAFVSPSIIILINGMPWGRVPAFYALFGAIWPLTFVVYPAFLISFRQENTTYELLSFDVTLPLFFIAWLGPVVHFVIALISHRNYIQKAHEEEVSWGGYFAGFI